MPSHTISMSLNDGGDALPTMSFNVSGEGLQQLAVPAPNDAADLEIAIAFTLAELKSILLYASKALTIKTNSSSTPDDTIDLPAGKPWAWQAGGPAEGANTGQLLTADVTAFFVTNPGSTSADDTTLYIRVLSDATP